MYSREIINVFLVGQVSGLVENLNIGIFSDTINVINVKFCMMVVFTELYPFMQLTFSDLDCISRSQQCQTVLTENVMFLSSEVETL